MSVSKARWRPNGSGSSEPRVSALRTAVLSYQREWRVHSSALFSLAFHESIDQEKYLMTVEFECRKVAVAEKGSDGSRENQEL
jgi:hypothetical protein